jgi:hypothetical protein
VDRLRGKIGMCSDSFQDKASKVFIKTSKIPSSGQRTTAASQRWAKVDVVSEQRKAHFVHMMVTTKGVMAMQWII